MLQSLPPMGPLCQWSITLIHCLSKAGTDLGEKVLLPLSCFFYDVGVTCRVSQANLSSFLLTTTLYKASLTKHQWNLHHWAFKFFSDTCGDWDSCCTAATRTPASASSLAECGPVPLQKSSLKPFDPGPQSAATEALSLETPLVLSADKRQHRNIGWTVIFIMQ